MSRIGKKPIDIPASVNVTVADRVVTVKGPLGTLQQKIEVPISVSIEGNKIFVKNEKPDNKKAKSLHGLYRALIANMIKGVVSGFKKEIEIQGLGYRVTKQGNKIILNLGFSHPIEYIPPKDIKIDVPSQTEIVVSGIDKQKVGEVAARLIHFYPAEPYKGKGLRYKGAQIRRKVVRAAV